MRYFDNGAFFTVQCTTDDVEKFATTWPCSGFRYGDTIEFQFDKRNGDLVDVVYRGNGRVAETENLDAEALSALSYDALCYGKKEKTK